MKRTEIASDIYEHFRRSKEPVVNSLPGLTLDGSRKGLIKRKPGEYEFYEAVMEFAEFVIPYILSIPWSQQLWVCQSRRCDDVLWSSDVNYGHL